MLRGEVLRDRRRSVSYVIAREVLDIPLYLHTLACGVVSSQASVGLGPIPWP